MNHDSWLDYCRSVWPINPPDDAAETHLLILICSMFAIMLIVAVVYHATFRKRPVTPEEFEEANDRILARMPLLKARRGEALHWLCRVISRDLLQVTAFVSSDITRSIRTYRLASFRHFKSLAPIVALIHENDILRREAIQIEILYRIKPLRGAMVGLTRLDDQILDSMAQPLGQYCSDNLQHDRF